MRGRIFVAIILFLILPSSLSINSSNYEMPTLGIGPGGESNSSNYKSNLGIDPSEVSNASDYKSKIGLWYTFSTNTAPTAVTLTHPTPGDQLFTNRTPRFNWTESTDAQGDSITYTFQLSLTSDFASKLVDTNVSTNYYDYTSELDFTIHYWRVTPYDGKLTGDTSTANFTVVRSLVINLDNSTVDFGTKALGDKDNTTDDSPKPFTFINQGNYFADLKNLTVNQSIWESQALNTSYFKIKARNSTSINGTGSKISFVNVESEILDMVHRLNYSSGNDNVSIDLLIEVPPYEAPTTGDSKRTAGMDFYWEDST